VGCPEECLKYWAGKMDHSILKRIMDMLNRASEGSRWALRRAYALAETHERLTGIPVCWGWGRNMARCIRGKPPYVIIHKGWLGWNMVSLYIGEECEACREINH